MRLLSFGELRRPWAVPPAPVAIAVADPGLRSALTARLGLAGETVHVALDPGSGDIDAESILIVDESRCGSPMTRPRVILIADGEDVASPGHPSQAVRVARRHAARAAAAQVAAWRALDADA